MLESYSKNVEEATAVEKREFRTGRPYTPEELVRLRTYGGSRALIMEGRLVSLVITTDNHHGHQWHLSMAEAVGPGQMGVVSERHQKMVLNTFFSIWEAVPNPGKLDKVLHFVGND